jgi:YHS domain-containing protein
MLNRTLRAFAIAAVFVAVSAVGAMADPISNYVKDGVAIGGADPVAYFTMGKPVQGVAEFKTDWNGVTWQFSSAANRDAFVAEPTKYAPQFGGYCAVGAAFGKKVPIDASQFKIVEGKLYLNSGEKAQSLFLGDEKGTIAKATGNWPKIETVPADKL